MIDNKNKFASSGEAVTTKCHKFNYVKSSKINKQFCGDKLLRGLSGDSSDDSDSSDSFSLRLGNNNNQGKKKKINLDFLVNVYFLLVLTVVLSIISLAVGVIDFNFTDLFKSGSEGRYIILVSRIPRTAAIILTGMGLALSGLIMQSVSANRFVSPTTAGTMSWCQLGILIATLVFSSSNISIKILLAFAFALVGNIFFLGLLEKIKLKNQLLIPLIGLMLGAVVEAFTSFVGYNFDILQNIQSWTRGSFSLITQGRYELLYLSIPLIIISVFFANHFTLLSLGRDMASNLGLSYKKIVRIALILVSLISSSIIVTVGSLPFVGLVIPNLVSLLVGDNIKSAISRNLLLGSCFLLASDILGRLIIFPYEINVSTIASILGSSIFLVMVINDLKKGRI